MTGEILYVSSNQEHIVFEARVRRQIQEACGGMPIISVTQQPIDFGRNIVVGDVGVSGFNMFRQVLIGLQASRADYVISCEADTFYPPDYFTLKPGLDDDHMNLEAATTCYRCSNLYVMPQHRAFFWRKPEGATHAQVVGRRFYLETLERLFAGAPEWSADERNFPKERWRKNDVFDEDDIQHFDDSWLPVVQVKTSRSMRHYTHSDRVEIHELPYWGTGPAFRRRFYDLGERH